MRAILLYILLVGIPVLGVVGILRLGQGLRPPTSVGGTWVVEIGRPAVEAPSCIAEHLGSHHLVLSISQSGTHLLVTLSGEKRTTLEGEIKDGSITAGSHRRLGAGAEAPGEDVAAIGFHATVDRREKTDRLLGMLTFSESMTRAAAPFIAMRQPGIDHTTGGH
jgi:hypothetical protein